MFLNTLGINEWMALNSAKLKEVEPKSSKISKRTIMTKKRRTLAQNFFNSLQKV